MIVIVNKAWWALGSFLNEFIECVSDKGASLNDSIQEIENKIETLDEEVDIHTVNKIMAGDAKKFNMEVQYLTVLFK